MLKTFLYSMRLYGAIIRHTFLPGGEWKSLQTLKRICIMLLFLPLFGALQALHWLGFLIDELFFRAYRKVDIHDPVFVIGVPRSGTTFLHRVLARDNRFTTFATWECVLAPSVSERKFWRLCARADRAMGRPLQRALHRLTGQATGGLDTIHKVGLSAPEEDYLVFLPVFSCFALVALFPNVEAIWRMGYFDREIAPEARTQLMRFYRKCVQKHLYVHGEERQFLSKNASFAGMTDSLRETFPGARFFVCVRDPVEVVPSQLSALQFTIGLFASDPESTIFTPRMVALLQFYYQNLFRAMPPGKGSDYVYLDMRMLQSKLALCLEDAYQHLGISMSVEFEKILREQAQYAKAYKTRHTYGLEQFGLNAADISARFGKLQETYPLLLRKGEDEVEEDPLCKIQPNRRPADRSSRQNDSSAH